MATVDPEHGDLIDAFAQLPMQVMCELLGVPPASVGEFSGWTTAISAAFGLMTPDQLAAAEVAIEPLLGCVADIVAHRRTAPADDLISALLAAEDGGDQLTREETVAMTVNLLAGGHDTTASQIGCSLFTLLQHPEGFDAAVEQPELVGSIVNETIRLEPSLSGAPRTVVQPAEIGGIERPPGSVVLLTTLTANRDPSVWHDPDAFVAGRFRERDAPKLLSFGAGPHYCLGTALARMTLEETVRVVAPRRPALEVDADDIGWATILGRSPRTLPVTHAGR
jgi:cytochrome P450